MWRLTVGLLSSQRMGITLSDGRRILMEGPTSLASVVGLVQGLTA
ncbi:oxidoreductase [Celeribacter baekdonensis]|uniref:Oxidoreductase n=1 Tax=Celeribacter baekdonensis TaxID=875171 RepID=A0A2R4M7B6_9RHOB|nr:oxidoreductase [Celeribacter baekdonensis]